MGPIERELRCVAVSGSRYTVSLLSFQAMTVYCGAMLSLSAQWLGDEAPVPLVTAVRDWADIMSEAIEAAAELGL